MKQDEIQDAENQYNTNGLIYFTDFCEIVAKQFRMDDETGHFDQELFRVLAGPKFYEDEGDPAASYDSSRSATPRKRSSSAPTSR